MREGVTPSGFSAGVCRWCVIIVTPIRGFLWCFVAGVIIVTPLSGLMQSCFDAALRLTCLLMMNVLHDYVFNPLVDAHMFLSW